MTKKEAAEQAARQKAKAEKFVELAEKRTTKAINAVRGISKLSNKNNYIYTPEQIDKIAEALKGEVVAMFESFNEPEKAEKEVFTL